MARASSGFLGRFCLAVGAAVPHLECAIEGDGVGTSIVNGTWSVPPGRNLCEAENTTEVCITGSNLVFQDEAEPSIG